jgi:hypothetical protein
MWLMFLSLATAALWVNLLGAGIAAHRFLRDYAVARAAGPLAACLVCFGLEQVAGWGPRPFLLPVTTAASLVLVWRNRGLIRRYLAVEVVFAVAFLLCLAWRFVFPDIGPEGDGMPSLALIEGCMRGGRLPAPDLWMVPLKATASSGLPPYAAGLLARILGVGPGVAYHLSACALAGLVAVLFDATTRRLCSWRPGRVVVLLCLLLGGMGAFLAGGGIAANPVDPLWRILADGAYGPGAWGFLMLSLACAIMSGGEGPGGPADAVLGATVPLALLSSAWIFPFQFLLVGGWYLHRASRGGLSSWIPAMAGVCVAAGLSFPYLLAFSQGTFANRVSFHWIGGAEGLPGPGWWITFWPAAGVLGLALLFRPRRPADLFFSAAWILLLAAAALLYNQDGTGGANPRVVTARIWWPWVYAGVVATLGASGLGSGSRVRRLATLALLAPTLVGARDLVRELETRPRLSMGRLTGDNWIVRDIAVQEMVSVLSRLPDGVAIESDVGPEHTESPAVTLFSAKQSFIGWPAVENRMRGADAGADRRAALVQGFYLGTLPDPRGWLLSNSVRYVVWLPRDCVKGRATLPGMRALLAPYYFWHPVYKGDEGLEVGFFERSDLALGR